MLPSDRRWGKREFTARRVARFIPRWHDLPNGRCRSLTRPPMVTRERGCGVLILKPLSRAIAEGDRVYASIQASATNQNARQRLTAPNPKPQETLLRQVYARAGISPPEFSTSRPTNRTVLGTTWN